MNEMPTLWALGFGAPGLLSGLALAGAPLAIHLFFRQRYREVHWAAIPWLLEAVKKSYRRVQLQQWLLLAIRTLLIAAVVLAMARPSLSAARAFFTGGGATAYYLIVIDNSMSMLYRQAGVDRWERAKRLAHSVLDDARAGDRASVIVMGPTPSVLVGEPSPYLQEVAKEIDSLRPRHGAARIEPALQLAPPLLAQAKASVKHVVLITDLQRSTWQGTAEAPESTELARRVSEITQGARLTILDVGSGDCPNSAVVGVKMLEPVTVLGRPTLLQATFAHHSPIPRNDLKVELLVDGQVESTRPLSLAAGDRSSLTMSHVFKEPGPHVLEVRLPEDQLSVDDSFRAAVRVRSSLSAMVIDGEPGGEPFTAETDYLRVALAPSAENESGSLIRVDVKSESDLADARLDEYDLVIGCNITQFTEAEVGILKRFVHSGGGLILFWGTQSDLASYNRLLFDEGHGLSPARFVAAVGQPGKREPAWTFDPLGYRNPVISIFENAERTGLLTTKVFRYVKTEPKKDAGAEVALAYSNGDPAIVIGSFGKGRVAIVTTSADLDGNTWAISPSFVPVVQELARQMVVGRVQLPNAMVGEPLVVVSPREGIDVPATLTGPNGMIGPMPLQARERDSERVYTVNETDWAGVYRILFGPPVNEQWPLAVHPPAHESDLARLNEGDLRAALPQIAFELTEEWRSHSDASASLSGGAGGLERPILFAAMALALIESLTAWFFGHRG